MNGIIKKVSEEKKYYIALVVIFIISMMICDYFPFAYRFKEVLTTGQYGAEIIFFISLFAGAVKGALFVAFFYAAGYIAKRFLYWKYDFIKIVLILSLGVGACGAFLRGLIRLLYLASPIFYLYDFYLVKTVVCIASILIFNILLEKWYVKYYPVIYARRWLIYVASIVFAYAVS